MKAPVSFPPPISSFRRLFARKKLHLVLGAGLLLASVTAAALVSPLPLVRAWGFGDTAAKSTAEPLARLSKQVSVRAEGRGAPFVHLADGRDVIARYEGDARLVQALERNAVEPLALASADFDEDGAPDLVSGYAGGATSSGMITIHHGNVDAIYPNAPEAQQRKASGTFTESPFLSPARAFGTGSQPDFIGAGDFDADGHWDVVTAARGGQALSLMSGDGRGGVTLTREIPLPGAITALTTGEVNRADGLTDVAIGIEGKAGARVLVFEGPDGALRAEPEAFDVSEPVTSLVLGQLDDSYEMDLAAAAGHELVLLHGRDRKLSLDAEQRATVRSARAERRRFPAVRVSLAIGYFTGAQFRDLALLTADGKVQLLSDESQSDGKQFANRRLAAWDNRIVASGQAARAGRLLAVKLSSARATICWSRMRTRHSCKSYPT